MKKSFIYLPLLAFVLLFSSTDTIQKYLGFRGLVVYIVGGIIALVVIDRFIAPLVIPQISERVASVLAVIALVAVAAIFFYAFPIANASPTGGSDADEALNLAANEILNGRYPYYPRTHLDNPILPLPGAIFLGLPFFLLGNSAFQALFWMVIFFFVARTIFKSNASALLLTATITVISPNVLQNLVTGTDRATNAIYVLFFIWLMVTIIPRGAAPAWQKILSAVLLGVGLSSRSNFLLLTPLVFSALIQLANLKDAIKYCAITAIAFIAITVPFYMYDPAGFAPLAIQFEKVAKYESAIPHTGILIPLVCGLLSAALAFRKIDVSGRVLFGNCAIVQMVPVVLVVVLSSIEAGTLELSQACYGMFAVFFAGLAWWGDYAPSPQIDEA